MMEVVVINKHGISSTKRISAVHHNEINRLYSKNDTNQIQYLCSWKITSDKRKELVVFGSLSGNVGDENKYELPPPIDNLLLFGNIIIVGVYNFSKDKLLERKKCFSLTKESWNVYYNMLYGNFESLGETDTESDSDDEYDDYPKSKSGYALDGFVVDDDEIEYQSNIEECDDEYEGDEYEDSHNNTSERDSCDESESDENLDSDSDVN